MDENKSKLTDHDYDGIQEYDNALPTWWVATFIGTVIFGSIYWLHYTVGGGPTLQDELKTDLTKMQVSAPSQSRPNSRSASENEEELMKLLKSNDVVMAGKALFQAKCASCHGNELQGIIGPNLVDDYWIHGKGHVSEIYSVVTEGVPEKGMPTWGAMLTDEEIKSVSVFVASQRGTKPANPKPPQGDKVANN